MTTIYQCLKHGVWFGDKRRPTCPKCDEILAVCRRIVNAQAEDEGLWATNLDGTLSISEAYLQQELRSLHAAVEGDLNAIAAVEDP